MNRTDSEASTDALLRAIADSQRRYVLRELADASASEVTVDALAEVLLDGPTSRSSDRRSRREIAIQLRHVHLPRLEDVGLCRYHEDRDVVEYCPDEFVESLLDLLERRASPEPVTED
ncbi:hypothetical protein L593_11405 [Salinarchaeum sp. Harcht-Bsk1]|uniref:DUF7344 domain-containing protein n=1 Tax=Salinarchaeum sp. Harcht-Bsk1 TaxID=1333523 RepID=UPI0003423392|nr:hypothetical protein [Salinarchaeum sp. Harcht-Bsk1]AGN02226.1 hypothetical protein L593_11405 [Salinarchaeum sp. Harcht-Bsk1]